MSNLESIVLYLLIAIISTCFFMLHKHKNKIIRYFGIIMCILIPSIMAGIRFNVGTDYANYYWTFEHLSETSYGSLLSGSNIYNMDTGFLIASKFLRNFFSSRAVFGIWSIVILIIIVSTLYSYRNKYDTTIIYYLFMLLYYFNSFNILRQVIAACIILWGIKYIFRNKPIYFLLIVTLASIIHFSALLSLPIWFIWDHKNNRTIRTAKKWAIILVVLASVIFIQEIIQRLSILNLAPILKYSKYLSGNNHANISFIVKTIFATIFILNQKKLMKDDEKIGFFIFMFIIGTLIDFTGYFSSFIKRSAIYYSISEIIIFSRFTQLFTERSNKIVRCSIIVISSAYFILGVYILGQGGLIPYTY